MTHARTHTGTHNPHAHTLVASTRSLHRPACCLQSPRRRGVRCCCVLRPQHRQVSTVCSCSIVRTTNKQLQQTCPMDVAATSVRRSDRMHRFADSDQACPSRLSICHLFGCAGHSSNLRIRVGREDRARKQVQRVADPSSQPPSSRRSFGAWWPDEGSAL